MNILKLYNIRIDLFYSSSPGFYLLNVSFNAFTASFIFALSFKRVMNLLPMMAPLAFACAASKVALFDMPKPINRGGLRRSIPFIRRK